MLVSLDRFVGIVKGSAPTVPVVIVPLSRGYQLTIGDSILTSARGDVRVFVTLEAVYKFCKRSIAPGVGRLVVVQIYADVGGLF